MAYRELGALPREHAYRIRPRPGFTGPGVMKVWDDAPPTTPLWQNRATAVMPRSGRPAPPRGGLLPQHYQALEGYDDGLGFSLKPPKWLRKLTIKKAIVPLAVVGASLFIPGAAPLLAKGIVGASKLVVGGGRLLGKGVTGLVRLAGKNVSAAATVFHGEPVPQTAISPQMDVSTVHPPTGESAPGGASDLLTMLLPRTAAQGAAQAPSYGAPSMSLEQTFQQPTSAFEPGSTAPISSTPLATAEDGTPAPAQAGMSSAIVPLAVAGAALLAITLMPKKGR